MAGLSRKFWLLLVVFTIVRVASALASAPSPGVDNSRGDELNDEEDCCAAIQRIETIDETVRQVFWHHEQRDGQCDLLLHEMNPKNDYVAILGICNGTTLEKIKPFSKMDYTLLLAHNDTAETINFYNISTLGPDSEALLAIRSCSCPKSIIAGSGLESMLKSRHFGSESNVDYVLVNVEQGQVLNYLPLRCTPHENLVFRVNLTNHVSITASCIGKVHSLIEIGLHYNGTVLKCKGSDEKVISPAKVSRPASFQDFVDGFKALDLHEKETVDNTDPDIGTTPVSFVDISIGMNTTVQLMTCHIMERLARLYELGMSILRGTATFMALVLFLALVLAASRVISEVRRA